MTLRHRTHRPLLALLALSFLTLPVAAQKRKKNAVTTSFATATETVKPVVAELPRVVPPGIHQAKPSLMLHRDTPGQVLSRAQKAVRDSDRHFQYGKFFIQEGKPEDARREFDLAIDTLLDLPETLPDRALVERKFEELIRRIHRYDLEELGSGVSPDSPIFTESPLAEILDLTFPIDPRLKDRTLAQVQAAQSQLPLIVNDAVLSYINYFTSERGRRTLYGGLRRAGRYRDMIVRILSEEGVPRELIHLAQAESGFMPRAVSRKAAAGMWQFIRSRGKEYGLNANTQFDERLDPEKATRAAARHLRDLYNQLGDWHLAMAAYNCGPFCVERAVQRTGYADFWELRRRSALPRETMNYVPAILAMAIVSRNLDAYGLAPVEPEPPMEYDTIHVTAPTHLALIADAADVPAPEIRELNPSLVKSLAPAGYQVRVPADRGEMVMAALESVPEERRAKWRLHRVSSGDTLASIARQYSTAANTIVKANQQLDSSFFEAPEDGELLLIPTAPPRPAARRAPVRRSTAARKTSAAASKKPGAATKRTAVAR